MSDGIKPEEIRDLAYQYMKVGWEYGHKWTRSKDTSNRVIISLQI